MSIIVSVTNGGVVLQHAQNNIKLQIALQHLPRVYFAWHGVPGDLEAALLDTLLCAKCVSHGGRLRCYDWRNKKWQQNFCLVPFLSKS
jgi:hypothetical protein